MASRDSSVKSPIKFVNIHGQAISTKPTQSVKKRATADKPDKWHKGWRVEGHPPLALENARIAALKVQQEWDAMNEKQRTDFSARGGKPPKPFADDAWRANTRLKAVRPGPYQVLEAAKQCADLAKKAGWMDVRVAELSSEAV